MFWEKDVPLNDDKFLKESFRMERSVFSLLMSRLDCLKKRDTNYRNAIPLDKRIAIAVYSLGSSTEYRTIGRLFGVAPKTVCKIFHEFCKAVVVELTEEYITSNFLAEAKIAECVQGYWFSSISWCNW